MEENGIAPLTWEDKRSAAAAPDAEVVDKPTRRRFSPSYKLRIVEEADRCTEPGRGRATPATRGLVLVAPDDMAQGGAEWVAESAVEETRSKAERTESAGGESAQAGAREHSPGEGTRQGAPDHRRPGKSCRAAGIEPRGRDELVKAAEALATYVGVKPACDALRVARATFYRRRRPSTGHQQPPPDPSPCLEREGTRQGLRHAVFGAIRGPVPGRGCGDPARRRRLPVQRTYDVSRSGLPSASSRAPSAAESSRIPRNPS